MGTIVPIEPAQHGSVSFGPESVNGGGSGTYAQNPTSLYGGTSDQVRTRVNTETY